MNWGTSCLAGNMSMAIFVDNRTMFNDAVDAYKFGFTNTDDGCAGVAQYIANEEGQCFESGRDQSHTMGGIAHLVEPAMIAWNQGVNLVTYENNRLVVGMEYTARFNLGNDVPFTNNIPNPCNIRFGWLNNNFISQDDRGDFSPVFVMANTLFEYAGIDHPYTDEVASLSSYFPEYTNSDHPGMGHLLYSGATDDSGPATNPIGPVEEGTIVHITKRNARGFAIDGNRGAENGQNVYIWAENDNNVNQQWIEIDRGNGYNQNQHWQKVSVGGNAFQLVKRNAPGFALDGGSNGQNGQNIQLWRSGSSSQNLHWYFS